MTSAGCPCHRCFLARCCRRGAWVDLPREHIDDVVGLTSSGKKRVVEDVGASGASKAVSMPGTNVLGGVVGSLSWSHFSMPPALGPGRRRDAGRLAHVLGRLRRVGHVGLFRAEDPLDDDAVLVRPYFARLNRGRRRARPGGGGGEDASGGGDGATDGGDEGGCVGAGGGGEGGGEGGGSSGGGEGGGCGGGEGEGGGGEGGGGEGGGGEGGGGDGSGGEGGGGDGGGGLGLGGGGEGGGGEGGGRLGPWRRRRG